MEVKHKKERDSMSLPARSYLPKLIHLFLGTQSFEACPNFDELHKPELTQHPPTLTSPQS